MQTVKYSGGVEGAIIVGHTSLLAWKVSIEDFTQDPELLVTDLERITPLYNVRCVEFIGKIIPAILSKLLWLTEVRLWKVPVSDSFFRILPPSVKSLYFGRVEWKTKQAQSLVEEVSLFESYPHTFEHFYTMFRYLRRLSVNWRMADFLSHCHFGHLKHLIIEGTYVVTKASSIYQEKARANFADSELVKCTQDTISISDTLVPLFFPDRSKIKQSVFLYVTFGGSQTRKEKEDEEAQTKKEKEEAKKPKVEEILI